MKYKVVRYFTDMQDNNYAYSEGDFYPREGLVVSEARIGDFSDKASLVKAFEGINKLLFVSVPYLGIQKNVVEAAKECSVSFIAYTSIFGVNYPKFGLEINHRETEQWIKESGIPYTILRNNWYIDLDEGLLHAAKKNWPFPLYFSSK